MRKCAFVVASCALLAACGSETSGTFTAEDGTTGEYSMESDGDSMTATITTEEGTAVARSGAGTKADLPVGFTLYPGATVISNTKVSSDGQSGSMTMIESADSPEKIAAFYRKQAEAAGFEIKTEATVNESLMIAGEGPDKTSFMVNANLSGDKTVAQLLIGKEGSN